MKSALLLFSLLCATNARAGNTEDAQRAFAAGREAYQRGDYQAALVEFHKAEAIQAAPNLTYNIAVTYEKLGQTDAAASAYSAYLKSAGAPKNDEDRRLQESIRAKIHAFHALPPTDLHRLMINLKLGPGAFASVWEDGAIFNITAEFGIRLWKDRLYLIFPVSYIYQPNTSSSAFHLPIGIEYDQPIVRGLYVTFALSAGFALFEFPFKTLDFQTGNPTFGSTAHYGGVVTPEIGIKYTIRNRVNLGIDLLSFPIQFDDQKVGGIYRCNFYVGVLL